MLDILKFTFESYSHYWGMIFLIFMVGGGTKMLLRSIVETIVDSARKKR